MDQGSLCIRKATSEPMSALSLTWDMGQEGWRDEGTDRLYIMKDKDKTGQGQEEEKIVKMWRQGREEKKGRKGQKRWGREGGGERGARPKGMQGSREVGRKGEGRERKRVFLFYFSNWFSKTFSNQICILLNFEPIQTSQIQLCSSMYAQINYQSLRCYLT